MMYRNLHGSVVKFAQALIEEINSTIPDGAFQFYDWDAHAETQELPNSDLLGPHGLAFVESENVIEVTFAIAVSTYGDENLFRLRDGLNMAFEKMRPTKTVEYYDAATTSLLNKMVIASGTMLAPVGRATIRPWQFVQATALLEIQA
ncbi:hypothetical protein IZ6_25160 [Terrihabitans soli]|uniref:DUF3168 domain-containing protein n=1 Tax=Terrihabitans soli TaxID=708113 RepID=A0A6S6QXM4_9HYPH|nr:hypothetical protein [Terrihabitans soli]BCJ91781.1 hypothetical protein IZ6_25160 [Terrihabitans soli]